MNGHAGIDTIEATEHLKNILNVGKSESESAKPKSITNGSMDASGDGSSVLNERRYQKVELYSTKNSSQVPIFGDDVDVYSSPLEYNATSSQILVEDKVDFGWEEKYYYGRIICMDLSGLYLAYILKTGNDKPGYVRVLRHGSELRTLIKDYKTEVKDIAFAHTTSRVLLGSVDACGEFSVHKIEDDLECISCTLIIRILRPYDWTPSDHNRLIWCLYIPDDSDNTEEDTSNEDVSTLLVVTHNEKAEIWNIDTILKEHGPGSLRIDEVKVGVQTISDYKMPISTATFSPDGTALAIGSLDGVVKFFQVNTLDKDESPRCLHQWIPHPDKSLSSLYFLDNHKNHRPDIQFWKFAVTGAENNTELKVWSCETWACLQTIRIHPNPNDGIMPCLKAEMDLSSKYLFLSDVKRKVLFILLIQQEPLANNAFIRWLSEYRVLFPVLNLAVVNFTLHGGKSGEDEGERDQLGDMLNGTDGKNKYIVMKLYWIQTKSLQACHIHYRPKETPKRIIGSVSSLSQDTFVHKDGLSDISLDARDTSNRSGIDLDNTLQKETCVVDELFVPQQPSVSSLNAIPAHMSNFSNCAEVLLTPDDFTSPSHSNLSAQNSSHHEEIVKAASKNEPITSLADGIDSLPVDASSLQRRKSSQHSATSSPSREVAEILAPTKGLHPDENVSEAANIEMKENAETINNNLNSFSASAKTVSDQNQQDYHVKEWPEAPDPNKDYQIQAKKESDIKGHNQCFLPNNGEVNSIAFDMKTTQAMQKLSESMEDVTQHVERLADEIQDQRCEIQGLKEELNEFREEQKHNRQIISLLNKLDNVVTQYIVPNHSRLEGLILKNAEDQRRRADRELEILSDDISSTFGTKLENTLKQELSNCILPQINRVLDTVAQKMQLDFSQKLGTADANLQESFMKHVKGKGFVDSLTQSISTPLQNGISSSCRELFQSCVVPSFEKTCHQLFQQLNEMFSKGTSEYFQAVERQGQAACSSFVSNQMREELNNVIMNIQQIIHAHTLQTENHGVELMKQHESLLSSVRQIVHEEVKKALKEEASIISSRAQTPVSHSDPALQKQQLMQLVKQGNINEAFQQALSAMDVQLVLFLCENVNVDQVFGTIPCPLQQHVLLSLVNQLSSDLSVKTDIKVRYIEDVVAILDNKSPIIRDHICNVLENLQQKISAFLQKNPNHKLARNLRRISMAVQYLIKV